MAPSFTSQTLSWLPTFSQPSSDLPSKRGINASFAGSSARAAQVQTAKANNKLPSMRFIGVLLFKECVLGCESSVGDETGIAFKPDLAILDQDGKSPAGEFHQLIQSCCLGI